MSCSKKMLQILSSALSQLVAYWPPLLLVTVITYFCLRAGQKGKNLPPGPRGWPIVGYLPYLNDDTAHLQFMEMTKKYGNVIRVKLGANDVVVLNDFKSTVEAFDKTCMAYRPVPTLFQLFGQDVGLSTWNGDLWKDHRRFSMKALRTLGVGKPEMENVINEEIEYLCSKLDNDGKPIKLRDFLSPSSANVALSVITGRRYNFDHPNAIKFDKMFNANDLPKFAMTGYVINFLAIFRYVVMLIGDKAAKEDGDWLKDWFDKVVHEHKQTITKDNPRDLIDAYIDECEDKKSPHFSIDKLFGLSQDLIGAGSGSTKDSIEWLFLNLAMDPDAQKKVHEEIDSVIGRERRPTHSDRADMPYTQAAIHESLRHGNLLPFSLTHCSSEDTTVSGYDIPKGTHILVNYWAIHHDPKYWSDPEKFDPTRFLSDDGRKLIKKESFMPFSYGKRSCPGQSLAEVQMFLYITSILQKFRVEAPNGKVLTTETRLNFFNLVPKEILELVFKSR